MCYRALLYIRTRGGVSGVLGGVSGVLGGGGVGALGGVVVSSAVCLVSSVAYMQPPAQAGHARGSSVRRAVLLLNRGFGAEFRNAITLIINYLSVPFRMCFTKQKRVKK